VPIGPGVAGQVSRSGARGPNVYVDGP
jgi:hypothetical protein